MLCIGGGVLPLASTTVLESEKSATLTTFVSLSVHPASFIERSSELLLVSASRSADLASAMMEWSSTYEVFVSAWHSSEMSFKLSSSSCVESFAADSP